MATPTESITPIRKPRTAGWFLASLLLATLATWYAYIQVDRPLTGIDDANIFLTYGQHLSRGEGFVYYSGGERVEGFTSLLWTLVGSLCFLVTDHPETLLLVINIALLGATLGLVIRFLQTQSPQTIQPTTQPNLLVPAILTWGWCLLNPKFVIWTTVTLMDSGLWCFVFTAGTLAFARAASDRQPRTPSSAWLLSGYLGLALLTRPEAMLIGLVWLFCLFIGRLAKQRPGPRNPVVQALWDCRIPVLGYLLVLACLTCFRLIYFGYPLPNTYYAKVSPSLLYNLKLGLGYLRGFFLCQWWAGPACLVTGLLTLRLLINTFRRKPATEGQPVSHSYLEHGLVALATSAIFATPVLAGGDHFNLYRFFQTGWPLLLIAGILPLYTWGVGQLSNAPKWLANALVILLLVTFCTLQRPWWNQIGPEIQVEFDFARGGRQLGERLNSLFPADQQVSLGVITTGGVGFTYRGPLLDLMGLNNVSMGHSSGDRKGNKNHAAFHPDVFFELNPDLVDPRLVAVQNAPKVRADLVPVRGSFWDGALQQVHQDKRFRRAYRAIVIRDPGDNDGEPWLISSWCKPDIIARLLQAGIQVQVLPDPDS